MAIAIRIEALDDDHRANVERMAHAANATGCTVIGTVNGVTMTIRSNSSPRLAGDRYERLRRELDEAEADGTPVEGDGLRDGRG